jgi:hypothetical protein
MDGLLGHDVLGDVREANKGEDAAEEAEDDRRAERGEPVADCCSQAFRDQLGL